MIPFQTRFKLSSLRLLGTVGEPINPEVWRWYFKTIGKSKCPIIDTWWQTETGGMMLSPLPGLENNFTKNLVLLQDQYQELTLL